MAQTVANDMVKDKEKALKAAQNAKSKGGATIAEKIASEQERKANIQNAEQELAIWQAIASVPEVRQQAMAQAQAQAEAERIKAEEAEVQKPTLLDVVRTLYSHGKWVASKLFQRSFFDVAETPKFMQELGLRGDKFTIKYGVISRHFGKDGSHNLTESNWKQLPQALQNPFAISKITDEEDSYRIYTNLQTEQGEFIVVGVDVKNAGREIEVNAISTAFGRRNDANLPMDEEVIYMSNKITPEQSSLLERPNFAQYPTEQELSISKDTTSSQNNNEIEDKNVQPTIGEQIQAAEAEVNSNLAEAHVKAETPTISQENEQVSDQDNAPYTIAPAQYTTKKGKVLDMHLVKFASTLTKEQQRAAKELAKADKGWYDREQGGFMMRSEESAKQLAETIFNNDEAVDDISNTEEDYDVLFRIEDELNFKAKYNLVGAGMTAAIESEEDLLNLKNLIDEVAYAVLENDYNKPFMYGGAYLQHNFIAIYTNKPTAPNPNWVWWHEQTHIAYERINLEDKHECGLAALEWLREQAW